jgi:hypothetical protein
MSKDRGAGGQAAVAQALAPAEAGEPDEVVIPNLVLHLMEQNHRDLAFTTNALIDGYREEAQMAQATIAAIRVNVKLLLDGPWMPSASALLHALYPTAEELADHRPGSM